MSRLLRIAVPALLLSVVVAVAGALLLADGEEPSRGRPAPAPAASAQPKAQPKPASAATLTRAVTVRGLVAHLRQLERVARRSGGHRAAGSRGYRRSVDYVSARLRRAGYRVRTQRVRFPLFHERRRPRIGGISAPRREVRTLIYSGAGSARGRVHVVPRLGCERSDFAGFPRGRIALVERGTCTLRSKVLRAQRAGAGGIVIFNDGAPGREGVIPGTLGRPGARIPALFVSHRLGRAIADRRGVRLSLRVDAESGTRTDANVLAELPGRAGGRVVMAGAHLDSVREGPGINDNGSGVATLLEIAEQASRHELGKRRRVRFAFWAAEELGLYGSRRYVRSLGGAERRRVAAYLNLDMVGSPNAARLLYGGNTGLGEPMARSARRLLARRGDPAEQTALRSGSDHTPFVRAGIPVMGLFSGASATKTPEQAARWGGRAGRALDPCYHRRCDRLTGIDRRALGQLADAAAVALRTGARR